MLTIIGSIAALAVVVLVCWFILNKQKNRPVTDPNNPRYVPELDPTRPTYNPNYVKPKDEYEGLSIRGVKKKFGFGFKTPNGITIGSTVNISGEFAENVFRALEYGITNQINATKHKFPNWQNGRKLSDYTILFIEPHGINEFDEPYLLVHGKHKTAGTIIGAGFDDFPFPAIVLPHQAKINWKSLLYLLYSAWNESEHDAEFRNLSREEADKYTGTDDIHQHHNLPDGIAPLLIADASAAKGFVSKQLSVPCAFSLPEQN
jgi:hypothetical protein